MNDTLDEADYRVLADFRHELRQFLRFSERAARGAGLTPQQHQALLAIRAAGAGGLLIGELAERLLLRANSVSELVDRLAAHDLVTRTADGGDRRQVHIVLTSRADAILADLSAAHRAELRRLRPMLARLLAAL
jgi:DNA-binding MarR family transcriptional regulator